MQVGSLHQCLGSHGWRGLNFSPACLAVWRVAIRFRLPQGRAFGLAHRVRRAVAHLELLL